MEIIQFIKQLNNTELGKGNTHDTYILIPNSIGVDEIRDIFEKQDVDYTFKDKENVEYSIDLKLTVHRENRVVGLGPYYRRKDLKAGDTILLEKRINNEKIEFLIDFKKNDFIYFKKSGSYFEALIPEYNDRILNKEFYYNGETFLVSFKERKKKRVDSPKETDLYDITLDGKSIANDYNAKDIIGFQLQENRVVFKKLIECRKMTYITGAEL